MRKYVLFFITAFLANYAANAADIDNSLVGCNTIKSIAKKKQCIEKATRSESKSSSEQHQNPAGVTTETITLKGVPFDKPDSRDALLQICNDLPYNRPSTYSPEGECVFDASLRMICNTMKRTNPDAYAKSKDCVHEKTELTFRIEYGSLPEDLAWTTLNKEGSLLKFEMTSSKEQILRLVELIAEKYGKPLVIDKKVENKFGTKFDNQIFIWVDPQGTQLTVESMHEKINEGRVLIESASFIQKRNAKVEQNREVEKSRL